jgi:hypothetical protein
MVVKSFCPRPLPVEKYWGVVRKFFLPEIHATVVIFGGRESSTDGKFWVPGVEKIFVGA